MRIAKTELGAVAKAIFKWTDAGNIKADKEDEFLAWALKAMEVEGIAMELPVEFQSLYRKFARSPDSPLNGDSLLLQADDREALQIYKGPRQETHDMRNQILRAFGQSTTETKRGFEALEFARRAGGGNELERAVLKAFKCLGRERRLAQGDPVEAALADPEQRFYWDTMPRYLGGAAITGAQVKLVEEMKALRASVHKGLDSTSTMVGFPIPVSDDVFNLLLVYGAFRSLGVRAMANTKTKFAKVTALPNAVFITPTATGAGRIIPADTALSGDSLTETCNIEGVIVEASRELLEDQRADLAGLFLTLFMQALAARLDYACFQGDGTDNTTSGAQTGIFQDATVAAVNANGGNVAVNQLERNDFLQAVGAVAPAALQRPCRWFINPGLIPTLMTLKEGPGNTYLLKTPAETQGEWHLVGWPVTWAAQAPSAVTPGSKVAAFGAGDAYLVGIREDLEIGNSDTAKWNQVIRQIRAISRARCDMRESTGWATLKLAQQ